MDGYIFTYRANLPSKVITELNYDLFGKILTKKGKKYYYPGTFDSLPYFKLANGCYFVKDSDNKTNSLFDDRIIIYKTSISISNDEFTTARKEKQKRYEGTYVKNL